MKLNMKIILTLLLCLTGIKVSAYDELIDGIYYNFDHNNLTATVTYRNYGGDNRGAYAGDIVIPEQVGSEKFKKTYNVTSIGSNALYKCSGVTSVKMPNGIKSIGGYSFMDCGLTSLTIPNSVVTIGEAAFSGCKGLNTLDLGEGVETIDNEAFMNCISLSSIIIPHSVKNMYIYSFKGCTSLKKVTFHCENIGYWFSGHDNLEEVVFGDEVKIIGDDTFAGSSGVFHDCKNLTSVTIGNGVEEIKKYTFYGCSKLSSLSLGNSLEVIGNCAFYGCAKIPYLNIPNSVRSIGERAFWQCYDLTDVSFGDGLTTIGAQAFYECSNLTNVTVGNSIQTIDENAFQYCRNIKKVMVKDIVAWCNISFIKALLYDYPASNPLYYAGHMYSDENTEITDLVIPDAVTEIKNYAFLGYMGLKSVVIPNSVTRIGGFAFYDAENITDVISYIQEPFDMNGRSVAYPTFSKTVFDNAVLWVPKGTIEKYKTTEGWKDFLNIKEINSSSVSAIPSSQLKVYANGNTLYISGANPGELINIYGIDGVCVKTITATNGVVSTPLTNGQTYIVKTMEKTVKIRM
ncbi:MAG: leucine-rich repeat domain-containing protein [Prevotella sp.]|nr:leucine-rich repeat domain-containing protein [Prevotella sp.]